MPSATSIDGQPIGPVKQNFGRHVAILVGVMVGIGSLAVTALVLLGVFRLWASLDPRAGDSPG
jgi:hypothetical protein